VDPGHVSRQPDPRDLEASLLVAGLVVALASAGLAFEGNWPKIARVSTAFVTYLVVLLAARGARGGEGEKIPFRVFALAGGAAGVVSGLVRREVQGAVVAAGGLAGAVFLGGIHWLALHEWRRLRSWTMR
jgi:hypothetical protein